MKQILFIIVLTLILSSCVNKKTSVLKSNDVITFEGAKIAQVTRETPDFVAFAFKPNQVVLGPFGIFVAANNGKSLIQEFNVEDPAIEIGEKITTLLKDKYSMVDSQKGHLDSNTKSVDKITDSVSTDVALIVYVRTVNWGCMYSLLKLNHYRIFYNVKLEILSNKNKKILAEGFYHWKSPKDFPHSTYKGLIDNNATILKRLLEMAKKDTITYFIKEVVTP